MVDELGAGEDRREPVEKGVAVHPGKVEDPAGGGEDRQNDKRYAHDPRRLVRGVVGRSTIGGRVLPTGLPGEGQVEEAAHVVRRPQRRDDTDGVEGRALGEDVGQHVPLRPEARERGNTGDGQPTDQEGPEGPGQPAAEVPHPFQVLLVFQTVDDRTRTKEEQPLVESVTDHQEDGGHVGPGPHGEHHVPDLGHRGKGQYLLDVLLGAGDGHGHKGRHPPDNGDHPGGVGRERPGGHSSGTAGRPRP